MIDDIIYNLSILLSTPYDNLNLLTSDMNYLDCSILEKIYLNKLNAYKRQKKLKSSFKNFNFNYCYIILENNSKFIKLNLNLKISFVIKNSLSNILSSCINEYIIILEHLNNKYILKLLIENEENPLLYNYLLNTDLSKIIEIISSKKQFLYKNKYSPINLLFNNFSQHNILTNRNDSSFNISEACNYAETYALNPNPKYKSFEGIGGDCTNFISQILIAGGFKQTPDWKPYTNAWIRVEELYSYLTSQNLGTKLSNDNFLEPGCLIQFYTPSIGKFFHNGFITYKLENNDYLYCCHSYNKLNYPLSEIYPNRYPKLRGLKFT